MEFINILISILGLGGLAGLTLLFQKFFSDDKQEKIQYKKEGKEEQIQKDLDDIKKKQDKTQKNLENLEKETKQKEKDIQDILKNAQKEMDKETSSFSETEEEINKGWENI